LDIEGSRWLVVGLGNPILGDDGVGWRVAEEVKRRIADSEWQIVSSGPVISHAKRPSAISYQPSAIEVDCVSLGGLSLMERLVGYERAILIDAISTGQWPVGSVHRFPLDALPDSTAGHSASAHDTSLQTALKLGRAMEAPLPPSGEIVVVAVEARSVYDFGEDLTPPVAAAVPRAVEMVIETLSAWKQMPIEQKEV
jgi:hydrogenase maturation protease